MALYKYKGEAFYISPPVSFADTPLISGGAYEVGSCLQETSVGI